MVKVKVCVVTLTDQCSSEGGPSLDQWSSKARVEPPWTTTGPVRASGSLLLNGDFHSKIGCIRFL